MLRKLRHTTYILLGLCLLLEMSFPVAYASTLNLCEQSEVLSIASKEQRRKRKKRKNRKRKRKSRKRKSHRRAKVDPALKEAQEQMARNLLRDNIKRTYSEHTINLEHFAKEPMSLRFLNCDRTLTKEDIKELYYISDYEYKDEESHRQLQQELLTLIRNHNYHKALDLCLLLRYFKPYDLTLLAKVCELAHHIKDPKLDDYFWAFYQVLDCINASGDGQTEMSAIKLNTLLDIVCFEDMWFKVKKDAIKEIKIINPYTRLKYKTVRLTYLDKDKQERVRYYQVRK